MTEAHRPHGRATLTGASPAILVRMDGEPPLRMTLQNFLSANADGIDPVEAAAICDAIAAGQAYTGGGGAAPAWTVEPVPSEPGSGRAGRSTTAPFDPARLWPDDPLLTCTVPPAPEPGPARARTGQGLTPGEIALSLSAVGAMGVGVFIGLRGPDPALIAAVIAQGLVSALLLEQRGRDAKHAAGQQQHPHDRQDHPQHGVAPQFALGLPSGVTGVVGQDPCLEGVVHPFAEAEGQKAQSDGDQAGIVRHAAKAEDGDRSGRRALVPLADIEAAHHRPLANNAADDPSAAPDDETALSLAAASPLRAAVLAQVGAPACYRGMSVRRGATEDRVIARFGAAVFALSRGEAEHQASILEVEVLPGQPGHALALQVSAALRLAAAR
ncbi:MAG: hypothetical protein GC145_06100 [Caulobacter sp.]|nr:hypothetical protein [Caulobacter sp.]